MCFTYVSNAKKSSIAGNIRYKVLQATFDGRIKSHAIGSNVWTVDVRKRAKRADERPSDSEPNVGFHVYLTKSQAMNFCRGDLRQRHVVGVIKVSKFVASGDQYSIPVETWKYATLIQVISRGGRDITKRYKK